MSKPILSSRGVRKGYLSGDRRIEVLQGIDFEISPAETVSIRGIVAGEYTVNVNYYLATTTAPVPVSVKIEKVNPAVEVIYYDTLMLNHMGEEKTAARFKIADSGNVLDVNHRPKSLIQLTRSVRRNAGAK